MASTAKGTESVYQAALVNYLVSMARTVEGTVNRAIEALLSCNEKLASEVFLLEPRINEMEIVIDEHAVRMLRGLARGRSAEGAGLEDEQIRLIVATLRINNDLERMADLAVNIGQRVLCLAQAKDVTAPAELAPMSAAVRGMVNKCLGALIYRNVTLAREVLESDDLVDQFRDRIFEHLLVELSGSPAQAAPNVQYVLASRYLERIADHATNIAEDVVYWVRGLDVRHGRGIAALGTRRAGPPTSPDPAPQPEEEAGSLTAGNAPPSSTGGESL